MGPLKNVLGPTVNAQVVVIEVSSLWTSLSTSHPRKHRRFHRRQASMASSSKCSGGRRACTAHCSVLARDGNLEVGGQSAAASSSRGMRILFLRIRRRRHAPYVRESMVLVCCHRVHSPGAQLFQGALPGDGRPASCLLAVGRSRPSTCSGAQQLPQLLRLMFRCSSMGGTGTVRLSFSPVKHDRLVPK